MLTHIRIIRIVLTVTDDRAHQGTKESHATTPGTTLECLESSPYPLASDVAEVLNKGSIFPLVLVVKKYVDWWKEMLIDHLNFTPDTSMVREFSMRSDSETLANGLLDAVVDFSCTLPTMAPTDPATAPKTTAAPPPLDEEGECCSICQAL